MNITLTAKDILVLTRLTGQHNQMLSAMGTSLRWTPEGLALRILQEQIRSRVDFLPTSSTHESYPK